MAGACRSVSRDDSSTNTFAPAPGSGVLEFRRAGSKTVLASAFAASPLRFLTPRNHGDAAWVYTTTFGGGMVNGDRVGIDVGAGQGTTALLSTQSSTKIYRSPRGCTSRLAIRAAEGAAVAVVPDPVVCFAGARYAQTRRRGPRARRVAPPSRRLLVRAARPRRALGVRALRVADGDRTGRHAAPRRRDMPRPDSRRGRRANGLVRDRPFADRRGTALRAGARGDARVGRASVGRRRRRRQPGGGGWRGPPRRGRSFRTRVAVFCDPVSERSRESSATTPSLESGDGRARDAAMLARPNAPHAARPRQARSPRRRDRSRRSVWRGGCASTTRKRSRSSPRSSSSSFETGGRSPS